MKMSLSVAPSTLARASCFALASEISLPRKIQTVAVRHFLHPSPPSLSVLADICVLEVKYDAYLPTIVSMAVQVPGRQAMACSKYALCRRFD